MSKLTCACGSSNVEVDALGGIWCHDCSTTRIQPKSSGVMEHQIGGNHYVDHKIQPWHIIEEYELDFWEGSALKYLLRRKNNRLEDLRKCRHYIDYLIERVEKDLTP